MKIIGAILLLFTGTMLSGGMLRAMPPGKTTAEASSATGAKPSAAPVTKW